MTSVPWWLRILLLALPRAFRVKYGEEIITHVAWMRERDRPGSHTARVIAYVVWDILRVGLIERLLITGTVWSRSLRLSGHSLAAGALLTFLGSGIGFGTGRWIGFALVPPALVLFGHGMAGRATLSPFEPRWMVWLAAFSGTCAFVLALQLICYGFSVDLLGLTTTRAMLPVFIGLVAGASLFGLTGALLRKVPALPSTLAVLGGIMLLGGPLDLGRVAELGFWLCVAGWVPLGLMRWVPAPEAVHGNRTHPT